MIASIRYGLGIMALRIDIITVVRGLTSGQNDSLSQAIAVRALVIQQAVDVASGGNVAVNFTKPTVAGYNVLLFIYSSSSTATLVATQNQCSYFYSDTREVSFRNVHSARYTGTVTFTAFVLLVKQALYGGIK